MTLDVAPPPCAQCSRPADRVSPVSPDRRVSKKYRRAHIRKLKAREYRRLRAVVPAIANKDNVTKVTVIEEAIKYIDELHQALVERIQTENDYRVHPEYGTALARELFNQSKDSYMTSTPTTAVLSESNRSLSPPHRRNENHDREHSSHS